jgi:hypothetical protein
LVGATSAKSGLTSRVNVGHVPMPLLDMEHRVRPRVHDFTPPPLPVCDRLLEAMVSIAADLIVQYDPAYAHFKGSPALKPDIPHREHIEKADIIPREVRF